MAACWILEGCSCVATKMNLFQAFQIAQVTIVQASNSLREDAERLICIFGADHQRGELMRCSNFQ